MLPELIGIGIELDKKRRLIFDHAALCTAELEMNKIRGLTGEAMKSFDELIRRILRNDISILLWAGLRREDPSISIDTVNQAVTRKNQNRLVSQLLEAINQSRMDDDEGAEPTEGQRPLASGVNGSS